MTAVIQRVINANVKIDNSEERSISNGLVILLGIHKDDTEKDISYLVDKIIGLRIFNDDNDKMNYSLLDINGSVLIISQLTLYGDFRRGRRPSFINASDPKKGKVLYNDFVQMFKRKGLNVKTGEFGAHMNVNLINNGPVTFVIYSNDI
ncbi:MAG: D-tyrosyl-tRNA(Tyr) deacylase [Candidatus Marinimicrobia bacterium]|nr:D-tyrosyl-tRNA(Tyr) deacylase [Candidatus Neomarinimicrobiota bacterium]